MVHNGHWLCPHCAARIFFDLNAGAMCAAARGEWCAGCKAEAETLCAMSRSCGPCPHPSCVLSREAVTS